VSGSLDPTYIETVERKQSQRELVIVCSLLKPFLVVSLCHDPTSRSGKC
jgi:hypothetical protein